MGLGALIGHGHSAGLTVVCCCVSSRSCSSPEAERSVLGGQRGTKEVSPAAMLETLPQHSHYTPTTLPKHSQSTPTTLPKQDDPKAGTLARLPLRRYITWKATRKIIIEWAAMYIFYCTAHGSLIYFIGIIRGEEHQKHSYYLLFAGKSVIMCGY